MVSLLMIKNIQKKHAKVYMIQLVCSLKLQMLYGKKRIMIRRPFYTHKQLRITQQFTRQFVGKESLTKKEIDKLLNRKFS